jgi:hypothetical protein
MAPLSHFAVAALVVLGVAAAPVPTQTSSSVTLQRRQGNWFQEWTNEMLEFWAEMGPINADNWEYKSDVDKAICLEKEAKGENDPKCKKPDSG